MWTSFYLFMVNVENRLLEIVQLLEQIKQDQDKRDKADMYE
jgi:hypothetical protein